MASPGNAPRASSFHVEMADLAVASKDPTDPNNTVLVIYTVLGRVGGGPPRLLTAVVPDQNAYNDCKEFEPTRFSYKPKLAQGLTENGFVSIPINRLSNLGLPSGIQRLHVCPRYEPDLVGLVRTKGTGKAVSFFCCLIH